MRPFSVRLVAFLTIVLVLVVGCSSNSRPTVRVRNDRATKANVQFKNAAGNTTNVNDVAGGSASPYVDVEPGSYTVTAVIQNESVSPTVTFRAENDATYTLVVVTGVTPTLRVDTP